METYTTIVKFFQDGGFFMYPIVLVLTIGLAIMLERWFYLSKTGLTNQMVWKKLMPMVSAGRLKEARDAAFKIEVVHRQHPDLWPRPGRQRASP